MAILSMMWVSGINRVRRILTGGYSITVSGLAGNNYASGKYIAD
jgi:hypothetical protein